MKIVKVGPNEYWEVPAGINMLDHLEPGTRIIFLEKLPPNTVFIGNTAGSTINRYQIDTNQRDAGYAARYRKNQQAKGLVSVTVWILSKHSDTLREFVNQLNGGKT